MCLVKKAGTRQQTFQSWPARKMTYGIGPTQVGLGLASQGEIFGAEKELIWFLVHNLAQKGAIKQWVIQCLIVFNN